MKFLFLVACLSLLFTLHGGRTVFCTAQEDELYEVSEEGESDNVVVTDEVEEPTAPEDTGSSNVEVTLFFIKPAYKEAVSNLEFPAGKQVDLLIGFVNKGSVEFTIEKLSGSLRYPLEFDYVIQNFSTFVYNRQVPPNYHCTLAYSFIPADSLSSRSFGLALDLEYKDEFGKDFGQKLYNETVTIVEEDEGLDGETFFLYVFLGALVVLLLVIGQHFLYSLGKKRGTSGPSKKQNVQLEIGTKKANSIDYDFIPKNLLNHINKGQKNAKRTVKQRVPVQRSQKT